jgi:hypothetical protein
MILELLLAVQLLETVERSTPQAVVPITKPAKKFVSGTLGGGTLSLIGPRAPVTVKPNQVAERYFRRPKGLN